MDTGSYCGEWKAIRAGHDLVVYGVCRFPTGGWTVDLEVGNQGINPDPRVLLLNLTISEPSGGVPKVITPRLPSLAVDNDSAETVVIRGTRVAVEDLGSG